jgi:hypothetical protein
MCRTRFRLNRGFGARLRRNIYGFSATSPFLLLYRSIMLALSLSRFHFRLRFIRFAFNSDRMAALKQAFDGMHSASLFPIHCFLFVGLSFSATSPFLSIRRSLWSLPTDRIRFRLNGGFGAGFRRNAFCFCFSAPSPLLSLHRSLPTVSYLLPTEWRLRSRLSMEYLLLLFCLSFSFSSSVSSVPSDCVTFTSDCPTLTLSLPTEWRLIRSML